MTRHDVVAYYADERYLPRNARLVREALARGERVMVLGTAKTLDQLHELLGDDAPRVMWVDVTSAEGAAQAVPEGWLDEDDHEQEEVVDLQRLVRRGDGEPGGARVVRLHPDPADVMTVAFAATTDLQHVRTEVAAAATAAGLAEERVFDLALAVHELAVKSVLHGGGGGEVRCWREGAAFVCEITDAGVLEQLPTFPVPPAVDAETGRGLWLVDRLCDRVDVRASGTGTVVRVRVRLPAGRSG